MVSVLTAVTCAIEAQFKNIAIKANYLLRTFRSSSNSANSMLHGMLESSGPYILTDFMLGVTRLLSSKGKIT